MLPQSNGREMNVPLSITTLVTVETGNSKVLHSILLCRLLPGKMDNCGFKMYFLLLKKAPNTGIMLIAS